MFSGEVPESHWDTLCRRASGTPPTAGCSTAGLSKPSILACPGHGLSWPWAGRYPRGAAQAWAPIVNGLPHKPEARERHRRVGSCRARWLCLCTMDVELEHLCKHWNSLNLAPAAPNGLCGICYCLAASLLRCCFAKPLGPRAPPLLSQARPVGRQRTVPWPISCRIRPLKRSMRWLESIWWHQRTGSYNRCRSSSSSSSSSNSCSRSRSSSSRRKGSSRSSSSSNSCSRSSSSRSSRSSFRS